MENEAYFTDVNNSLFYVNDFNFNELLIPLKRPYFSLNPAYNILTIKFVKDRFEIRIGRNEQRVFPFRSIYGQGL